MTDISDIETVDLTTCDREPIHIPGRIQSFGYLISVTGDWIVNHTSENIEAVLGRTPDDLLGRPLADLFCAKALHDIKNRLQMLSSPDAIERIFGAIPVEGSDPFDMAVHLSGRSIVIELEPTRQKDGLDYMAYVRPMIDRIQKAKDVDSLCKIAAKQVKALVGFDRVMVYRFAQDGSGEVVAEALNREMEPFLGLRYPASDIPKQARAMYQRNLLRIISDVGDTGSAVIPTLGPDGTPLDLTMSTTRAVSPIHLEYLRNMGVEASLSISILQRGKLWGLFACHHNSPRILPYDARTAAELFAQLFSFVLEQKLSDVARHDMINSRLLHDRIMVRLADGSSVADSMDMLVDTIQDVIPFDGAVSWIEGQFSTHGKTPTLEQFLPLTRFLNTTAVSEVFTTDHLSGIHEPAKDYTEIASGIMALPVSRSPRDYLVLFRREMIQSVVWAGNPNKPVSHGPNGARLTPRKSFEAWQQTVHGRSLPWTEAERRAAESLRMTLLEVVLRLTEVSMKERTRAQEQQELLIAELNHRVRNILNLIRGLVSQSSDAADVSTFIDVIGGRIQALARAHDQITEENWTPASIHDLIMTEAKAYLGENASRVIISGTDALLTPTAFTTVSLVIHEMMTNSAKYGALTDRHGQVEITIGQTANESLSLEWVERGGPPVAPPTRRGFGTTIIERSIPYELKGKADVRYALAGVEASFEIPAAFIHTFQPISQSEDAPTEERNSASIQGTALVVEDNMIIALDAEEIVTNLGAANVFNASSVTDALRIIETEALDIAILDVNLGSETSEAAAIALQSANVPFIFATGYGDRTQLKDRFPDIPVVQKPYSLDTVEAAIARLKSAT